jgi:hypothetical protein
MKVLFDPILGKVRKSDAGAATWGAITGNILEQSDLTNLLANVPVVNGTTSEYVRGDGSLATFPSIINSIQITVPNAFTTSGALTSNGTIAITASGSATQYIKGDGTLAEFPALNSGTVTSVGISVPAAFSVTSPITTSGTLAITADGTSEQYIRGDGELANFPVSLAAGGASVNYFLNGSVNTSSAITKDTIVVKEMMPTARTGVNVNFTRNTPGIIASFCTNNNTPNAVLIPPGNWNFSLWASVQTVDNLAAIAVRLFKVNSAGTIFTQIGAQSTSKKLTDTDPDIYTLTIAVPQTVLLNNERLLVEIVAVSNSGNTITIYTEGDKLAQVTTTFSTGILSLNGLSAQVQSFAIGTTGTAPVWSPLGSTHSLNIPNASAVGVTRGLISKAQYDIFNNKQGVITLVSNTTLTGNSTFSANTLSIPNYSLAVKDNGTGLVTQASAINFTGTGYTLSAVGREVTVNLTGGGGGGVATASNNLFAYYNFI